MISIGHIPLTFQIGSYPREGNKCEIPNIEFQVISKLSVDCVIGQDILQQYFDGFNHQENKLYFGSQWNKQYYIALHPYNITTSINKNNNYNNNNDIRINPIQQQQNNNNLCEEEIIPSMIISDNDLQQNITSIAKYKCSILHGNFTRYGQ